MLPLCPVRDGGVFGLGDYVLSKDTEFLKREAKRQIEESKREFQEQAVQRQETANAVTIAPDAGRDTTDPLQQIGRPLHAKDIQKRLTKLNPNLCFELSISDSSKTGIYLFDGIADYFGKSFICGMESGISPEFSIRKTDGWRTVLAMLIRRRLIEKYATENAFLVHFGKESENWSKYVN
jgi:hypothetical protein